MNIRTRLCSLFILLVSCACSAFAAQLSGWTDTPTTAVDLTAEGTLDWAHWGFNGDRRMNHKASGGGGISALTGINSGPYGNDASGVNYTWNDGSPDAACAGSSIGVRMINTGDGVTFTIPADTSTRTVRVYVTGHHSTARVRGHLSDGSAADWQDETFFSTDSDFMAVYVMTYTAASAGQTLTVTLLENGNLGDWQSVNLHAVTLRAGTASPSGLAPAAPTVLDVIPGDGRVALHWSRMSGVSSYNLYRSTNATPGSPWRAGIIAFHNDVTPSQAGFMVEAADATATNGQAWHYWVSAVNGAGEGPRSAEAIATPVAAGTANVTKTRFLSILPLGDSITYGYPNPNGGYRPQLISDLSGAGFSFKCVGSYRDNSTGMADPYHEGWPGRTIEQIRDGVVDRALGTYVPDVILLMIGTNNLAWGDKNQTDVDSALTAYDGLLAKIFADAPNTDLIVSPILPIGNTNSNGSSKQPLIDSFNQGLLAKVQALAGQGKRISWAAQMSAITLGQLVDGVHPKSENYPLLGDAWLAAIQALVSGTTTPQVLAPSFAPAPGSFSGSVSVSLTCATPGASIRYSTDGSTPTGTSTLYAGPSAISATTTLRALAQKSGMSDSAITVGTYTITATGGVVSAPSFAPAGGSFTQPQTVTLSCATAGATIRSTTDGSSPNGGSPVYSGPVTVNSSMTIKAIAQKAGMSDSATTSASYTITASSSVGQSSHHCGVGAGLAAFAIIALVIRGRFCCASGVRC